MPSIAAGAKSIIFGDFNYYWIADRQGRTFKRLNELFATTGQVGFLASQRVDGRQRLAGVVPGEEGFLLLGADAPLPARGRSADSAGGAEGAEAEGRVWLRHLISTGPEAPVNKRRGLSSCGRGKTGCSKGQAAHRR